MMKADKLGLYVHIPFCIAKCNYCDFCSFPKADKDTKRKYIDALCRELLSYKRVPRLAVDTIFFGGGTPSMLEPPEFEKIVNAIGEAFDVSAPCEFTLEANPKTLTVEKCRAYRAAGFNRISIGLQSIHDNELKKLGRIHNFNDFLESFEIAHRYFDNISVDLMYGIPEQTKKSFEETLHAIARLPINHISAYGLIIEEGTPFYEMRDRLPLPSESDECDMYGMAHELLTSLGFTHYEISNYARQGFECRHNLKYWHAEEYIGVGLAAASCFGKIRYVNSTSLDEYFKQDFTSYIRSGDNCDEELEYAMLRLRLAEGISLSDYKLRFGKDFRQSREALLKKFERLGFVSVAEDRISFTQEGFYISNYLLSELL